MSGTTTLPVTIDTSAPSAPAAVLNPASDSGVLLDNITSDTTPTISGSGATPGDTITLKTAGGTVLGTAVVAGDGSWAITPTVAQPEGLNNFKVTATDPAGNVSGTTTLPVTIDTQAANTDINLALQIRTDTNNDGLIGPSELGAATAITSRATFSNSGASAAVAGHKIVFTASNGSTSLTSQTCTLTAADITNGYVEVSFLAPDPNLGLTQTVTANYVDLAGNQASTPVVSDSAQVIKDNSTATVDILSMSSDNGLSPSDFITSDATLQYSGTVTNFIPQWGDRVMLQFFNSLNVQIGGNVFVNPAANGAWSWDDTGTVRAAGNYSLKATLVSSSGTTALNSAAPSSGTGGGYDQQALQVVAGPTIALTSSSSSIQNGSTATITFTLSAASKDFDANDVTLSGGTLSAFTGATGFGDVVSGYTKYTATFTSNSASANGVISVASDRFSDASLGYTNSDGADANNTVTLTNIVGAINSARMGWEVGVINSGYWNNDPAQGGADRASDLTLSGSLPSGLTSIQVYVYAGGALNQTINWSGGNYRNSSNFSTNVGNLTAKALYNGVYYNFAYGRTGNNWNTVYQVDSSSPLVIDLNGDGIQTTGLENAVLFDLNADGTLQKNAWLDSHDGFLVIDRNHNGVIDSGAEMFGNHTLLADGTTAASGWQAIVGLDSNLDGLIDAHDEVFMNLKLWLDANVDGNTDSGELHSLQEMGIESLEVNPTVGQTVQNGNIFDGKAQINKVDGSTTVMSDVWFHSEVNTSLLNITGVKLPTGVTLANNLSLSIADLLALPENSQGVYQLKVVGDENDKVQLLTEVSADSTTSGQWSLVDVTTEGANSFGVYHYSADPLLKLLIDQRIGVLHTGPVLG